MRILIVEDEPDLLASLAQALREEGYAVDTADNGDDGLFNAVGTDYDAIVLDVMLPGRDGWEILKRLRQTDPAFDAALTGAPWLGMNITELGELDRVLVVGSFMRKDHPLMTQRLRQAAKQGTKVCSIDIAGDDPLLPLAARDTVLPSALADTLAQVAQAVPHRVAGLRIEAGRGLVQEHQLRLVDERPRDLEPTLHSA